MKKILSFLLVACLFSINGFAQKTAPNTSAKQFKGIPAIHVTKSSSPKAMVELTYVDGPADSYLGFGAGSPITANALAYFPANVISTYEGEPINEIHVCVANDGAGTVNTLKVCIWTDTTNHAANPAYEQTVTNVVTGWNEVQLDTPYVLGTEAIFIGYHIDGAGYVLGTEDGAAVEPNGYGDIICDATGTAHLGDYNFGDLGIKAFGGNADPIDAELTSINTDAYLPAGEHNITGTITNKGVNAITSYDVVYGIDDVVSNTYSVTGVNIAAGATHDFTHDVPADFSGTGIYELEVTVANVNGGGETSLNNNRLTKTITVMNEIYTRNVMYEEGTGTWCGWCPRGHVGLNTMAHNVTDGTWIGIAAHNGDPMAISGYTQSLGIQGYPSGMMNRSIEVDPGLETLEPAYLAHKAMAPMAKIEITNQSWDKDTRNFDAEVAVTFALDIPSGANFNVALIVLEDSVRGTGSGYAQANYYRQNGIDLIDWDGTNWKNLPNPVPAADMYYNHVARELVGGFNGVGSVIPSTVASGTPYTHTFSSNIPASQNENLTHLVAFIIDNNTKAVVNAVEAHLDLTDGIADLDQKTFKMYPNPSTGIINLENVNGAQIMVYNILGEMVYSTQATTTSTTIDLSDLQAGNYIVRVVNGKEISAQKVILTK